MFKNMGGNIPGGSFLGGNFSGGSFLDTAKLYQCPKLLSKVYLNTFPNSPNISSVNS